MIKEWYEKLNAGMIKDFNVLEGGCVIATSVNLKNFEDDHSVEGRKSHAEQNKDVIKQRNTMIGVLVAAYGRYRLFEVLRRLGRRVLYYDTDSICFFVDEGEEPNELLKGLVGVNLGQLSNVLNDYGDAKHITCKVWIDLFFSGGPKNYGFRIMTDDPKSEWNGYTVFKVKGLSLNRKDVRSALDFEKAMDAVLNGSTRHIAMSDRIVRSGAFEVLQQDTSKSYRATRTKRREVYVNENMIDSVPWIPEDAAEYNAVMKQSGELYLDILERYAEPKKRHCDYFLYVDEEGNFVEDFESYKDNQNAQNLWPANEKLQRYGSIHAMKKAKANLEQAMKLPSELTGMEKAMYVFKNYK